MRDGLHRLDVHGRNAALRVLHNDVEHSLAVTYSLFGHTSQIDLAKQRAVFRIEHRGVLRRMTERVHTFIEWIEVNPVRLGWSDVNGFDELQRFRVEHRDRPAAG